MNGSRDSKDITAREAGLKVKNMIAAVEQKMADGEKVSAGPANEKEAKALKAIREENQKSKI